MKLARFAWAPAFAGVTVVRGGVAGVTVVAGVTLAAGMTGIAWADSPSDYRSHAEIAKGSNDTLHRVTLPFEVYRDARPDFADLRVFNAAGESLPFAFASEPAQTREEAAPVALPMFPVAGAASIAGAGRDNLGVVVKSTANGTIISVQGRPANGKADSEDHAYRSGCWMRASWARPSNRCSSTGRRARARRSCA